MLPIEETRRGVWILVTETLVLDSFVRKRIRRVRRRDSVNEKGQTELTITNVPVWLFDRVSNFDDATLRPGNAARNRQDTILHIDLTMSIC